MDMAMRYVQTGGSSKTRNALSVNNSMDERVNKLAQASVFNSKENMMWSKTQNSARIE